MSSVHEILQARILEWVAFSFSRGSFQARDWTQVSCIAGVCFTIWATRKALLKLINHLFMVRTFCTLFIKTFSAPKPENMFFSIFFLKFLSP